VHFQEWWVRLHASVPAADIFVEGAAQARPAPGVLEAIAAADVILFPPSNPVVSIGAILAVPAIAEAVRAKTVVGVSPIIGGAPVRGMADACLAAIGVPATAQAVAAHYGPGLLNGWLVDEQVVHRRRNWDPTPIPHLPMALHVNTWPSRSRELAGRLARRRLPAAAAVRSIAVEANVAKPVNSARADGWPSRLLNSPRRTACGTMFVADTPSCTSGFGPRVCWVDQSASSERRSTAELALPGRTARHPVADARMLPRRH